MPLHIPVKHKLLKLQQEFCGTILFVIIFPEKFISDQGMNFESDLINELCKIAGVQKLHTTPYHPRGNEQCERFN